VGSTCHVVHSGVSEARNVIALFFRLGWDRYGFDKNHARTRYNELVFLLWGTKCHRTTFNARVRPVRIQQKAHRDTLWQTCFFFASGGICGSCSAFQCVQVGPVRIQQKVHQDTLHQTCVFASGGICGLCCAIHCIWGMKWRSMKAQVGPVRFT
jgi:hypothetical protein